MVCYFLTKWLTTAVYLKLERELLNNARLWVACDDSQGNQIIKKQGYVIRGSKNWSRYNLVIQNIPNNTSHISFGVLLNGAGEIQVKNYSENFSN